MLKRKATMLEIELIDHLGDFWKLLLPATYTETMYSPKGCPETMSPYGKLEPIIQIPVWTMWVYVGKGPDALSSYQEIPLPIFTEWWA